VFVSTVRKVITERLERGESLASIARALGLAHATVSYHVARLRAAPPPSALPHPSEPLPPAAHRQIRTRDQVANLLSTGRSRAEIARILGIGKSTVTYHANALQGPVDERCARRYDWPAVQRYYEAGHSLRECCETFGFSTASWHRAVRRGEIRPRPTETPIEELLSSGVYRGRSNLKRRLLAAGLKKHECERCGLSRWFGEAVSFALHHINGDRQDNRLENLQLLCPNCHSQTDNFSGRQTGEKRPWSPSRNGSAANRISDGRRGARLPPAATGAGRWAGSRG